MEFVRIKIANKYKTNEANVERDMRTIIEVAFYDNAIMKFYFKRRPSCKEFLYSYIEYIEEELI